MSQSRIDDLYDRLTSRKLWLALLSIGFALWGYHMGDLTAQQFQTAVMVAVTAYTAAEGASDALAAWGSKPPTPTIPTVDEIAEALEKRRDERNQARLRALDAQMKPWMPPAAVETRGGPLG